MNLIDTGPLIAIIDRGQGEIHSQCTQACQQLSGPLLTTWPCFTEAMYFLAELRGWSGQHILWQMWERGVLLIHNADRGECERMKTLMKKYQDTPMDLADASLVAVAETLNLKQIFTLDSDFYVYRLNDKDAFEVIPR
ncbi:MAG: PIN domain-containing protein [Acaryochloris sp. RU_4_1]|nr:PIN domain-containing protein [Leptolyngbyaceae cyanobacterium SU_3_3]NJM65434.1 PIN domain-containing protein [Acaryochloris sp. RU_4_1]NJR53310.1 PIN domain-containing protein [Acaryochloris sp. CRU_2_0]